MSKRRNESVSAEEEEDTDNTVKVVKKRKEVTTASILENFLLLATSLDDTIREEDVIKAMGGAASSRGSKTSSTKLSPLQTRLLHELNKQRQTIRTAVRENINTFSDSYDIESARLGVEDETPFEYDLDEQVNLTKERWTIKDAIEKLKEMEDELKMDCVDLGRKVRQQEKRLTGIVDDLVEQRVKQ